MSKISFFMEEVDLQISSYRKEVGLQRSYWGKELSAKSPHDTNQRPMLAPIPLWSFLIPAVNKRSSLKGHYYRCGGANFSTNDVVKEVVTDERRTHVDLVMESPPPENTLTKEVGEQGINTLSEPSINLNVMTM